MSSEEENVEQTLFVCKECFVYKLPPRTSSAGYRAADWDITTFLWSGKISVRSIGEKCIILLEDSNSGELFATCPITPGSVESVSDSSRYFVLKIDDGRGHHAFVGMGFTERSEAFDFNAALQDHQKFLKQKKESELARKKFDSAPHKDYSLPEGAKIHVNIKTSKPTPTKSTFNTGTTGFLLPPPGSKKISPPVSQNNSQQQVSQKNSDIWSDFTGSSQSSGWSTFK